MQKLDMVKIDPYMQRCKIASEGLRWLDPLDGVFEVSGFYWFPSEKRYHRFPRKMSASTIRPNVKELASCTAGGQLRFRSNSRRIVLSVKVTGNVPSAKMAETGRSGFDLYAYQQEKPLEPLSVAVLPLNDNGMEDTNDKERAQPQQQALQVICR